MNKMEVCEDVNLIVYRYIHRFIYKDCMKQLKGGTKDVRRWSVTKNWTDGWTIGQCANGCGAWTLTWKKYNYCQDCDDPYLWVVN